MTAGPERYLASRGVTGPWQVAGDTTGGAAGAVIIPALAESAELFATLRSLAANPPELVRRFLVLVVVNQREDAPAGDRADNLRTLELLAAAAPELTPLRLAWVDAATAGRELPAKGGGVGLARKIGHDLALPLFDWRTDPLLISLDADTLVEPSYLPALVAHFAAPHPGGAVLPFCHRPGATPAEAAAIERYELFLRLYVYGLALAGSPYAFHTIGSAMACRGSAYLRMGGMNSRSAGEDFYFLQQLYKTAGLAPVTGTLLHPSPRRSHRVPFGTGRSVSRLLDGDGEAVLYYDPACFRVLGAWLRLVIERWDGAGAELLAGAGEITPALADYLAALELPLVWDRLRRHHPGRERFFSAFHGWFDGLRTMKLIHHLSAASHPRRPPTPGLLADYCRWGGLDAAPEPAVLLDELRTLQNGRTA